MVRPVAVYLEVGSKRTFAGGIDWPGWSRAGRSEDEALEALIFSAPRYARAVSRSGTGFEAPRDVSSLQVVQRLKGGSGTDFGVPGVAPDADDRPLKPAEVKRQRAILKACWRAFDAAAEAGRGVELRKGPRGGGRDLAKMVGHVLEAEEAYLHQLGSRRPQRASDDPAARMAAVRSAAVAALEARAAGRVVADPNKVRAPWSPRYFVRRSAWHVLDHAWEIEDRST